MSWFRRVSGSYIPGYCFLGSAGPGAGVWEGVSRYGDRWEGCQKGVWLLDYLGLGSQGEGSTWVSGSKGEWYLGLGSQGG